MDIGTGTLVACVKMYAHPLCTEIDRREGLRAPFSTQWRQAPGLKNRKVVHGHLEPKMGETKAVHKVRELDGHMQTKRQAIQLRDGERPSL